VMDDIYGLLVTVDYPDAVTSGLRRRPTWCVVYWSVLAVI
jgi:predicted translin family RNA/ssDNA-binding protein